MEAKLQEERPVTAGDVVQIDAEHDKRFGGCFMLVTEAKAWGAIGFVQIPGEGQVFYRCLYEAMHRIGEAQWILADMPEVS